MLSEASNMMVAGTCLKDLKSFIDIAVTRMLIMGISRGGGGGGGGGGPPFTPSLTGGSLFVTSLHYTCKHADKGGSAKRQKKSPSGGITTR